LISIIFGYAFTRFEKRAQIEEKKSGIAYEHLTTKFYLKDIKYFSLFFWLMASLFSVTSIGNYGFKTIVNRFCELKYKFNEEGDNKILLNILTLQQIAILISLPLFGYIADKTGHKLTLCICSNILYIIAYLIFLFGPDGKRTYFLLFPLIIFGIANAILIVSLWVMIPIVVKSNAVGTAFGITLAIQNIGLAIAPLIINHLISEDDTHAYDKPIVFFAVCSLMGLILSIVLWIIDRRNHRKTADIASMWERLA